VKQFLLVSFALALCAGCDTPGSAPRDSAAGAGSEASARTFRGEYPIKATATVGMVADIVRNVGGEHVRVTQLMGSGVDPHLYRVTRDDVQTMLGGDMIFYSGLMLEGKMSDTLVKLANNKCVVAVTERIDEAQLLEPEDLAGHYDPHVWMDVSAWANCVDAVAAALTDFDPSHADSYRTNADVYRQRLMQLDEYGRRSLGSIPAQRRVLITSHDAFNYFGRAYGLEVLGVQGLSTESEAGLQRVNELVALIAAQGIRAVFVESSVPRKNIEALVEGARAKGYDVRIGGELFSDAMGEAGTYEGTYVGMLDHNITVVTRALGGDAPDRGMQGKLSHARGAGE
jgi:manganese/zinc/iron transport system substrate-binding protein